MKILVCGATGFMGRNIFYHLSKNPENKIFGTSYGSTVYHSNIQWCNLKDADWIEKLFNQVKPDIVIQAAATTSGAKDITQRPYVHVTDNAIMNSLLLRAAFEHKVRHFLFLSCGVMYPSSDIPQQESDWNISTELYKSYFGVGWTKIYVEKMCEFYSRLGMKCTAIRHTNTYGPYDKFDPDHSHVFGATVRKVMAAIDGVSKIRVWGNGEEARDLIYVDDVVNAIDILIQKQVDPFELVNVSYGTAITVNNLVNKMINLSGKKLAVEHDLSAPCIPFRLALDHSYMTRKYGWRPQFSIGAGIVLTLRWYKENIGLKES